MLEGAFPSSKEVWVLARKVFEILIRKYVKSDPVNIFHKFVNNSETTWAKGSAIPRFSLHLESF